MRLITLALVGMFACSAHAQESLADGDPSPANATDGDAVIEMDTVVVSGVQPGPGLWRVRAGEHWLYILGTQSPLPKDITWRSTEVDEVLKIADAALGSPGIKVDADVGFFRGLTLLPSAMKATKNPDGQKLADVLPPDTYARWAAAKQRWLPRDSGIEKKRPLIAVFQLYQEAVSRSGMKQSGVIEPVIERALKQRKLKTTPTVLTIDIEDPRGALADFRKETLKPQDLACFDKTLALVEHDLPAMAARANAWAVGDIEAIESGTNRDMQSACLSAWLDTDIARKRGLTNIDQRMRAKWMDVASASLQQHRVTFATVSVSELLKPGGLLDMLRDRGYEVESP